MDINGAVNGDGRRRRQKVLNFELARAVSLDFC